MFKSYTELEEMEESLRKETPQKKAKMYIKSRPEVDDATSPEGFMQSTMIKNHVINTSDNNENISPHQHKLIIGYKAADIIYRNAQRPWGNVTHGNRRFENTVEKKQTMVILLTDVTP